MILFCFRFEAIIGTFSFWLTMDIVAKMRNLQEQVEETGTTIRMAQAELSALLPAVLDRAFRGEL